MNTKQNTLLFTGFILIALIVVFKPIRYQNPFYLPIIESMSDISNQRAAGHLSAADVEKNYVAAGVVLMGALLGAYGLRDKHTAVTPAS